MVGNSAIGGGVVTLLSTAWYAGLPPGPPPPTVQAPATPEDALFETWPSEEGSFLEDRGPPECNFWNASVSYTSPLCNHFAIGRLASSAAPLAIERASRCAAHFETDCVLSSEIGLSFPSFFVYDPSTVSLRMLVAPRLIPTEGPQVSVKVNGQTGASSWYAQFNTTVEIEYIPGGSRAPETEVLSGVDAFCAQLLRAAYADECWAALD
jgi:hypothetical protein